MVNEKKNKLTLYCGFPTIVGVIAVVKTGLIAVAVVAPAIVANLSIKTDNNFKIF